MGLLPVPADRSSTARRAGLAPPGGARVPSMHPPCSRRAAERQPSR